MTPGRIATAPRRAAGRVTAFALSFLLAVSALPAGAGAVPAGNTADANAAVTYRTRKVAFLPGAVQVVERSALDPFVYVVVRTGTVVRMRRDGSDRRTVLDVSALTKGEGERGLLGLAFRRAGGSWEAFVNYTDLNGDTTIARWRVRPDGTFVRQPGNVPSVVISIAQPYANHNGGDVVVGPDNMLYIGMGDGGSGGDPERRAMDPGSLLGKILRIDPTHVTNGRGNAYRVPADNPFVGRGRPEIWSIGLRNPWRFVFDFARNLWVADVGQNEHEEVSLARASSRHAGGRGTNFGWSAFEASHRYNTDVPTDGVTMPVHEYDHGDSRCSISGAAVATERNLPRRAGWFLYGDYCSGSIVAFLTDGARTTRTETVATGAGNITSVSGTSRAVYYTTLQGTIGLITSGS